MEGGWLKTAEAMSYLGIGRNTFYRWLKGRLFRQYRPAGGGHPRYKREELDQLFKVRRAKR